MSKDLLKEAIADAKAVRETAIANAKLALEEAFTPRLQSMLSHKIAEETEDEMDDEMTTSEMEMDDEYNETKYGEDGERIEETEDEDDMKSETEEEDMATEMEDEDMKSETEEEDMKSETEEDDMAPETEEEDDLELESIIRELEEDDDDIKEDHKTEDPGDEVADAEGDNEAKPLNITEEDDDKPMDEEEGEELDLGEVIKALQEEEEEEVAADEKTDELEEAYNTIKYLKDKINEVNLLNAKLLFSNKLFRGNSLNESQKMKVIETFDRANSVREVKLVYSTLAESLKGYKPGKKRQVTEGFASKATNSTKPNKNVIVESNNFSSRMKKLAGLL